MLYYWFLDNNLSICVGGDKIKPIWFGSTHKIKNSKPLSIHYNDIKIKVTYLGDILDEALSKKSIVIHVINKINSRLRSPYRQNRFFNVPLRRLLCNSMIQPFFEYACNSSYPNIDKKLKMCLQASQSKCIRFCLKLNDKSRLKSKDFKSINWLSIHERVSQCSRCSVYKFFTKNCPILMRYMFL